MILQSGPKIKLHLCCFFFQLYIPNRSQWKGFSDLPKTMNEVIWVEILSLQEKEGNILFQSMNKGCSARRINNKLQEPKVCNKPVYFRVSKHGNNIRGEETDYCIEHTAKRDTYQWHFHKHDCNARNFTYYPLCTEGSFSDTKAILLRILFIKEFHFQKCNCGHVAHISERLFKPLLNERFLGNTELIEEIYRNLNLHPHDIEEKGEACYVQLVKLLRLYITGCYMYRSRMESLNTLFTHFYQTETDQSDSLFFRYMIETLFCPTAHLKAQGHINRKKVQPWV